MPKVIVLAKRRAWRDFQKRIAAGRPIAMPRPVIKRNVMPPTDMALVLSYLFATLKK